VAVEDVDGGTATPNGAASGSSGGDPVRDALEEVRA
jgi:hypothetical protein